MIPVSIWNVMLPNVLSWLSPAYGWRRSSHVPEPALIWPREPRWGPIAVWLEHPLAHLRTVTHRTAARHQHPQDEYLSAAYNGTGNNSSVTENKHKPQHPPPSPPHTHTKNDTIQTHRLPGNCNYVKLFVHSLPEHTAAIRCSWLVN